MTKSKIETARHHLQGAPGSTGMLEKFIGPQQRSAMLEVLKGEEGAGMADKVIELAQAFKDAPVTYQQDGKGKTAIAHFHYFLNGMDFYITELDMEDKVTQAFGWADLGHGGGELGYISITDLIQNNVELDLYWVPRTLLEAGIK